MHLVIYKFFFGSVSRGVKGCSWWAHVFDSLEYVQWPPPEIGLILYVIIFNLVSCVTFCVAITHNGPGARSTRTPPHRLAKHVSHPAVHLCHVCHCWLEGTAQTRLRLVLRPALSDCHLGHHYLCGGTMAQYGTGGMSYYHYK